MDEGEGEGARFECFEGERKERGGARIGWGESAS